MTSNDPLLQPYVLKHLTLRNLHAAIYDALRLARIFEIRRTCRVQKNRIIYSPAKLMYGPD